MASTGTLAVTVDTPPVEGAVGLVQTDEPAEVVAAREGLVAQVTAHARATAELTGRPDLDPVILKAMRDVPRHAFVPEEVARFAYLDIPLPAGNGLRESQPFMTALMTDLVTVRPNSDVLILGIGGGYHAAMASRIVRQVFCLELDEAAAAVAMQRLHRLGYANVEARVADPYYGWPEPGRQFDAIIIRLAVDSVPSILLRQLKSGGQLVAPVGSSDTGQQLMLFTKKADGQISERRILPVRFMRLPGGQRI